MRLANIPPPMALYEINIQYKATDVAIKVNHHEPQSIMIAVLHCDGCSLFDWPVDSMLQKPPTHKWTVNNKEQIEAKGLMYLQIAFSTDSSDQDFILILSNDEEASLLWMIDMNGDLVGNFASHVKAIEGIVTNGNCVSSATYLVTDENAKVEREQLENDIATYNRDTSFKLAVFPFSMVPTMSIRCSNKIHKITNMENGLKHIIFTLAENGSLYADRRRLANNCTSFLTTPLHLVFTTSQNLVKFVHMADSSGGNSPSRLSKFMFLIGMYRAGNTSRYSRN